MAEQTKSNEHMEQAASEAQAEPIPASFEDDLVRFSVMLRSRFSSREKEEALLYLNSRLQEAGVPTKFDAAQAEGRRVAFGIAGNIESASKVVAVGFDTPSRNFVPGYRYRPLDEQANNNSEVLNLVVQFLFVVLVCGLFDLLLYRLFAMSVWWLTLLDVGIFLLASSLRKNRHNANKSSVALAIACNLACELATSGDVAFLFCDYCAESTAGFSVVAHEMKRSLSSKQTFFLDCLASGEELLCARVGETAAFSELPELTIICRANKDEKGYYSPGARTEHDFEISPARAFETREAIKELLT